MEAFQNMQNFTENGKISIFEISLIL